MSLFGHMRDFDEDAFRNIVSLRKSQDLFDDLTGGDASMSAIAIEAEAKVKASIPLGLIPRGFHYTISITYPFEHEPYLKTRYGNGSYGVWYGSLALNTTIHETAFHMVKEESGIEGNTGLIRRERAVYLIHCQALLIDLSGKEAEYPDLVGKDYGFTQQVGERLRREGHPGLLSPSARHNSGINLVSFSPAILSAPRLSCYLTYTCDPVRRIVTVERTVGKVMFTLQF
jgi:RES domain